MIAGESMEEQLEVIAAHVCLSVDQLLDALNAWSEFCRNAFYDYEEILRVKRQSKKRMFFYSKAHHKLDLTRAKMQHQVLCRKPKRLVKKII
jgi:hypothetical protein